MENLSETIFLDVQCRGKLEFAINRVPERVADRVRECMRQARAAEGWGTLLYQVGSKEVQVLMLLSDRSHTCTIEYVYLRCEKATSEIAAGAVVAHIRELAEWRDIIY